MRKKQPAGAIGAFQRSLELNPAVAGTHHDLGVALTAVGRPDMAVGPLTYALNLDPAFAQAHCSLGHVYETLGQAEKAMASYRSAVALKPDLAAAHLALGGLYKTRGLPAKSAAALRAAAEAGRGTVLGLVAEARALEVSHAFDEALVAMRAAVDAHPRDAGSRMALAGLLAQAGHSAEAAAHYLRAAELAPEMGAAWHGVARNRTFASADEQLLERMKAALAEPMPPPDRQALHFALGKALDDMERYEEAMQNFEAGNRLRALAGSLNREHLSSLVERLIALTPAGYRDREADHGVDDATPVLIVGLPRSGSTLVEQILSSHPDVAAGGEVEFWDIRYPTRDLDWPLPTNADAARRLADDYLETLRAFHPGAPRVTDKMLANFLRLGHIHRVLPNATLVHCRRDPVDTALSLLTTNIFSGSSAYMARRGDIVFYIRQYQRLMAHWRNVLPVDRFIEVEYEKLVADPEPQTRSLIAACGLAWSEACLAPQLNTRRIETASLWQARQPIYRSSVERWRRYEPWLGELRELAR